jgi:hypothetical protein
MLDRKSCFVDLINPYDSVILRCRTDAATSLADELSPARVPNPPAVKPTAFFAEARNHEQNQVGTVRNHRGNASAAGSRIASVAYSEIGVSSGLISINSPWAPRASSAHWTI